MDLLTSDKNPLIKDVRRAAERGTLTREGLALAEGRHLLTEAIHSGADIAAILVAESVREELIADDLARAGAARVLRVADATFTTLRSTETTQGILTLVRVRTWTYEDLLTRGVTPLILVIDGIQDPGNAGALLRAAEAFSASGVIFLKGSSSPYNPKCLRASAGSIFRLPFVTGLNAGQLVQALQDSELPLYAADPRAATLVSAARLAEPCAIAIGAEGGGISPELAACATGVRIPTAQVESLNAAVAAGVVLYEASRQRAAQKS